MPQSSQNRQTSGGGPVFMLIGGALTVIAAGLSLYNGSKTREDNEKQREHERDMAQVGFLTLYKLCRIIRLYVVE